MDYPGCQSRRRRLPRLESCRYTPAVGGMTALARKVRGKATAKWRYLLSGRFDNERFWDLRYATDPELGSGIGSRGEALTYKRKLLEAVVSDIHPATILDVGCGDMAVGTSLPATGYLGVDLSHVVIDRNRGAHPGRDFVSGNFTELALAPADLVVCMDVLIHLESRDLYQAFVGRIVQLTASCGVVTGFEEPLQPSSRALFFYEPLSKTLRDSGATAVTDIGGYNEVRMFRFGPAKRVDRSPDGSGAPSFP
jgi:hypothetical protein